LRLTREYDRGVDLISDALRYGRLCTGEPDAIRSDLSLITTFLVPMFTIFHLIALFQVRAVSSALNGPFMHPAWSKEVTR